jgi:hypothetical protein
LRRISLDHEAADHHVLAAADIASRGQVDERKFRPVDLVDFDQRDARGIRDSLDDRGVRSGWSQASIADSWEPEGASPIACMYSAFEAAVQSSFTTGSPVDSRTSLSTGFASGLAIPYCASDGPLAVTTTPLERLPR